MSHVGSQKALEALDLVSRRLMPTGVQFVSPSLSHQQLHPKRKMFKIRIWTEATCTHASLHIVAAVYTLYEHTEGLKGLSPFILSHPYTLTMHIKEITHNKHIGATYIVRC